jgi:hypothetical protein
MSIRRFLDRYLNKDRYEMSFLQENAEKPIKLSIFDDKVKIAFDDFSKLIKSKKYSVIGGIAVGKYTLPRSTHDIDIIVPDDQEIIRIKEELRQSFSGSEFHILKHKGNGTDLEILTPQFIETKKKLILDSIKTSKNDDGVNVVDVRHLIALKLPRALNIDNDKCYEDRSDIRKLIRNNGVQDLSDLGLEQDQSDLYNQLVKECKLK